MPDRSHCPGEIDLKRDRLVLLAFFLSGAAALGYEILWTRLLSLALGSETLGILGTLAGFFGGLALGSFALHGTARQSRNPARLFAVLEGVAAAYAVASPFLLHGLARHLPPLLGPAAGDNDTFLALAISLGTALLVLLPATVPMGATLAALVEARRRALADSEEGRALGRLYGVNTLGAAAGVLAAVHLVLPRLGMVAGAIVLAGVGLAAAGTALVWARGAADLALRPEEPPTDRSDAFRPGMLHLILAGTGLAGVGLEVVGVQVLAQPLEDTVYTFAHILAVYLLGTAAGAWIYGRLAGRAGRRGAAEIAAGLLVAHAASVVLAAFALRLAPVLLDRFAPEHSGVALRLGAELVLAGFVFLVPTLLMGALASHLLAQVASRGVGRAYGFNTLGATLAPFLFGLGAIPLLGYARAFYLAAVAYLLLYALAAFRRGWRPGWTWGPAAAVVAALLLVTPTHLVLVPVEPGWHEVARAETVMGLVQVTEREGTDIPVRRLQMNKYFRMGGGTAFGERRMGHIPLLLAPGARTALFLGTSTGGTLSAVRSFPLERVEAVELVPEILRMMPLFDPINGGVYRDPRVRFHAADARRWVAASPERFDVIVADLFHPAKDGAGTLYSKEHFEAVREHLTAGGLFAQWIPLYQFDPQNLRTVVRTFLAVFPEVHSLLGIYNAETPALVLLGRVPAPGRETLAVDPDRLAGKLREPVYRELLMQDPRDLLGAYMLDREALAAYAGPGPLNTDFVPRVLFDAPRSVYEDKRDLPYRSLLTLLPHRTPCPETLVAGGDPVRRAAFRREVEGFSRALGHYLRGEVERAATGFDAPVPDGAWERYVLAYKAAPGFEPASRMLAILTMGEPGRAREIARRMRAVPAARP
jgi:spermidine synthase